MTPEHPSDPPRQSAWLPSGPFSYTDEGEGPVLVAVHGLPGSVRDYRWLASALAGRVRLVRLEHPAFGGTPRATRPGYTLHERVRFVLEAVDALGIGRYSVLGHSMGGPVAMGVAAAQLGRVERLILLASVGLSPHRLIRSFRRIPEMSRLLELGLVQRALLPRMRAGFVKAGFPRSTPDEAVMQSMRILMSLSFEDIRAAARRVRAPTTVAWTEDDPLVEPPIAHALGNELPPGPRLGFASGGHNLQKTRAVELADAIVSPTLETRAG